MTMRIKQTLPIVAVAASLGLAFASPALAQSQGGTGAGSSGSASSSTQGTSPSTGQQARTSSQGPHAMGQEQLRRQLSQAGFRDVQIIDAAYLVQARTQDGNTVTMVINPPSAGGTQGASMGGASGSQGASTGAGAGGSTSGAAGAGAGTGSGGSGSSQTR